jgi:hypothetical protein
MFATGLPRHGVDKRPVQWPKYMPPQAEYLLQAPSGIANMLRPLAHVSEPFSLEGHRTAAAMTQRGSQQG